MSADVKKKRAAAAPAGAAAKRPAVIPAAGRYARLIIDSAPSIAEGIEAAAAAAPLRTRERVAAENGKWHLFMKLLARLAPEERQALRDAAEPLLEAKRGPAADEAAKAEADAKVFGLGEREIPEALAGEALVPEERLPLSADDDYSACREGFLVDMILKRAGLAATAKAEDEGRAAPASALAAQHPSEASAAQSAPGAPGASRAGSPAAPTASGRAPSAASPASAAPLTAAGSTALPPEAAEAVRQDLLSVAGACGAAAAAAAKTSAGTFDASDSTSAPRREGAGPLGGSAPPQSASRALPGAAPAPLNQRFSQRTTGERPGAELALPPEMLEPHRRSELPECPPRALLANAAGEPASEVRIDPDSMAAGDMLERYLGFDGRDGRPFGYSVEAASPGSLPWGDGLAESGHCWCIRTGSGPLAAEGLSSETIRWSDRTPPLLGRRSLFDWGLAVEDTRFTRNYGIVCETEDEAESAALLASLIDFFPNDRPLIRFQPGSARWLAILPNCYTAGSRTLVEMHRGGRRIARIQGLLSTWVQISGAGPGGEPYLWWPRPLDVKQSAEAAFPLLSLSRWFDFALSRLPGATSFASPEAAMKARAAFLDAVSNAEESACLAPGEAYMVHALMTPEEAEAYLERVCGAAASELPALPAPIPGCAGALLRQFPSEALRAAREARREKENPAAWIDERFAFHPAESMAAHGRRMKAILAEGGRLPPERPAWPFPFDFPVQPFGLPPLSAPAAAKATEPPRAAAAAAAQAPQQSSDGECEP